MGSVGLEDFGLAVEDFVFRGPGVAVVGFGNLGLRPLGFKLPGCAAEEL